MIEANDGIWSKRNSDNTSDERVAVKDVDGKFLKFGANGVPLASNYGDSDILVKEAGVLTQGEYGVTEQVEWDIAEKGWRAILDLEYVNGVSNLDNYLFFINAASGATYELLVRNVSGTTSVNLILGGNDYNLLTGATAETFSLAPNKVITIKLSCDGLNFYYVWNDGIMPKATASDSTKIATIDAEGKVVESTEKLVGRLVSQASHGFVAGNVLYLNGGVWTAAQADTGAKAEAVGVVESATTNTFILKRTGESITLSGLTAGAIAYLSQTTAGAFTFTEPTSGISKPILIAESTTVATVQIMRGVDLSTSSIGGKQTISMNAGGMTSQNTNGAAAGSIELATNKQMIVSFDFDAATIEYIQFSAVMPKSWDVGTFTAFFVWSHAATTTNFKVAWAIQAAAYSDGDDTDVAWGTAVQVNDEGGTTDKTYTTSETAAFTASNSPASGDKVRFRAYRVATDATYDTLAIDARLEDVKVIYNTNASNDN